MGRNRSQGLRPNCKKSAEGNGIFMQNINRHKQKKVDCGRLEDRDVQRWVPDLHWPRRWCMEMMTAWRRGADFHSPWWCGVMCRVKEQDHRYLYRKYTGVRWDSENFNHSMNEGLQMMHPATEQRAPKLFSRKVDQPDDTASKQSRSQSKHVWR